MTEAALPRRRGRGGLPALRALVRLAARDARRDRARSLLVIALVAIPVAAAAGGLAVFRTTDQSPAERATSVMGAADLAVIAAAGDVTEEGLVVALPPGAEVAPVSTEVVGAGVPGGRIAVERIAADLDGPASGLLEVVDGRAPRAPGEVAVTPRVAEAAEVAVGEHLALGGEPAVVVGLVRDPEQLSRRAALVPPAPAPARDPNPDANPDANPTLGSSPESAATTTLLVDLPAGTAAGPVAATVADTAFEDAGFSVVTRDQAATRDTGELQTLIVLGGLALVEAALIAAAAFAVSTRRRQRELGLVAATGGERRHLRTAVVLSGVVLGGAGAVAGTVLGLAVAAALLPVLPGWADRAIDGFRVPFGPTVAVALLGVVAATAAAWVPARAAARLPVLLALSGRRPPTAPSRRGLVWGLVLAVAGGALVLAVVPLTPSFGDAGIWLVPTLIVVGSVCCVLGFGATSPWLLEQAGRIAPLLPVGARLALRDTARFRTRNGPVVSAVLAGLALSVAFGAGVATIDADDAAGYAPSLRADQLRVSGSMAATVAADLAERFDAVAAAPLAPPIAADGPGALMLTVPEDGPAASAGEPTRAVLGDAETVRALGAGEDAVAALEAGRAVLVGEGYRDVATVVASRIGEDGEPTDGVPVPAHVAPLPDLAFTAPDAVVSPAALETAGLPAAPAPSPDWLLRLPAPVTEETAAAAQAVAAVAADATVVRETGHASTLTTLHRVVLGLALATGLVVVAIALALAAAETRADQRTLLAVGADPRLRRTIAAGRALVLAGLGAALAVPAGLLPAYGLVRSARDLAFVVPWSTIAVVTLVLPAVAVAGAWALSRPAAGWTAYRGPA